uniref:Nucleotidyl transferase domain-containing protein n=1 Tax=Timema poppense TaxID=170557 RepID=A0A7R9DG56_TIMPO|nr:unnamed protein product [Timema poppensis]
MTIMATEATRQQSLHYGCIVQDKDTRAVQHYVEKPSTFVSTLINCGVYICSVELFQYISAVFNARQQNYYNDGVGSAMEAAVIHLEKDILMPLAGTGKVFAMQTNTWWSQLKTAGSTIYANRHFLELFRTRHRERLVLNGDRGDGEMCRIIGDVHIHPSATVHCSATVSWT